MIRSKKFILISHCIINQNSVVMPLARSKGAFKVVNKLIESGMGILQLPCPEFKYLGIKRNPMTKQEYDTKEYRELCRNLCVPILDDIREYINNGYEFCGVVGINESPTCSISGDRGIFMEEIIIILEKEGVDIKTYEIDSNYNE